jgi:hypothetical protein
MIRCSNCNKELIAEHSFCPNCGYDLRQSNVVDKKDLPQKEQRKKPSFLNRLGSPNGSIWISFFIGIIVMEMRNGFYKYFTSQNASIPSLIGSILGSGAGFLIVVLIPALAISLIAYAIKKKFPQAEFATLVYVFTILVSLFFLSTLF